ncbi:MAG: hypothetical protein HC907_22045 [Richelia sp. SM1_7_0]|nr:hypothetical protein [Richelia sp. SM1_7_0]
MLNGTKKATFKSDTNTVTHKFIKYQVNTLINTTIAKKVSKDSGRSIKEVLGELLRKYNFNGGINQTTFLPNAVRWTTEDDKVTIKDVWESAQNGFTIRGGIKIGGNSKEHVTESYFLLADIDNADNGKTVSYKESTATKWGVYANFWYASPSFTEDNQKHRLGFQFSRPCTVAEHETIGKFLKDEFLEQEIVIDPSCFDAGRLFYGSARKDVGEFFGYDILPVDDILELAKTKDENKYFNHSTNKISKGSNHNVISPKGKSEKKEISPNASITDKVLDYFYNEIFINKLNGDVSALYDIYDHKLTRCTPDETDMIDKYEGSNPFSDTNKSGKSFVICCWENQLPAFVDRSKNFSRKKMANGKFQHGGTFIDYFVFANKKVNDLYPQIKTRNELVGKNFKDIVKDICNYFNVPEFDFKTISEEKTLDIALRFCEDMQGKLFKFTGNSKTTTFFVYDEVKQYWRLVQNTQFFISGILTPWLGKEYGKDSREYHNIKLSKEIAEYVYFKMD